MLQCVAVCIAVRLDVLPVVCDGKCCLTPMKLSQVRPLYVAVCCSVFPCVLQCVAVCCSVA